MQGRRGELQGKRGEIQGKHGDLQGRYGEIQGKRGEIQGAKCEQLFAAMIQDLIKDGVITDAKNVSITFNSRELIVNKVKQSDAVFEKYKAKYIRAKDWDVYMSNKNGHTNMSIHSDDDN